MDGIPEYLTQLQFFIQLLLIGCVGLAVLGSVVAFAYYVLDRILEELLT